MATLADLKRALIQADKAGDAEAAGIFANEIKKAQAQGLTDTDTFLAPTVKKERTVLEKVKGAGEAALALGTGLTGGAIGAIGGAAKGIGEAVMSGEYGTQAGARMVEEAQQRGAEALTYQPTTQAGQEYLQAAAEPLTALGMVAPSMALEAQAISALSKPSLSQLAKSVQPVKSGMAQAAAKIPTPKVSPTVAQGAAEATAAAEQLGIPVMTTDISKPQTFMGKSAQMAGERIPLAGTGGMRETQQAQRVQAIKNVAQEYKADSSLPELQESVMNSLAKTRGDEVMKYSKMKNEVFDKTAGQVLETPKAQTAIDTEISSLKSLNSPAVSPVITKLEEFKTSLQGQDINNVERLRKILGEDLKSPDLVSVRGEGTKAFSKIYGALKEDMGDHIKQFGDRRDITKWNIANKRLAGMMGELELSALKSTLKKAEVEPEAITKLLYSQKPSEINALYRNLPPEGRKNARAAILGKIFNDSLSADGEVSTSKFLTGLDKMDKNVKVFFTGEDKAKLEGLKSALNLTRRAETANIMTQSGQQLYALGGIGAGIATGLPGLFGMGMVGLIARAYESAPVRNALLRMSKATTRTEQNVALDKLGKAIEQGNQGKGF